MSSCSPGLLLLLALSIGESPEDRRLAARIRDGDRAAFRTFFDRHHGRLFGYLRSRGVPASDAEDLVQTAFIYIWEHRDRIDPKRSLRAYLFRIGYTRALNRLRDSARVDLDAPVDRPSSTGSETPESDALTRELREALDAAIEDLPERRRAVFELCFLRDFTYQEAANALDITRNTVETHMRLALRDLRDTMAAFQD